MACKNCYNGCAEVHADKCIKYTGPTIEELDIENGDSLYEVQQSILNLMIQFIDGSGIKPNIDLTILCDIVAKYLPTAKPEFDLNDYLTALIQAACDIQIQLDTLKARVDIINSPYDVQCLTPLPEPLNSNTHLVLQATINRLCELSSAFEALVISLPTTYVKLEDLNDLIAAYLGSIADDGLISSRMVPHTVVEYYGPLSNFDLSGAGLGAWANIYLCNGNNGTPDKRGRVPVGATEGVGGGPMASAVDPANAGNPTYNLNTVLGSNTVTLTSVSQIPSHSHTATVTINQDSHSHLTVASGGNITTLTNAVPIKRVSTDGSGGSTNYELDGTDAGVANIGKTSSVTPNISVSVANSSEGGVDSHNNIQPVLACYYIMYIP